MTDRWMATGWTPSQSSRNSPATLRSRRWQARRAASRVSAGPWVASDRGDQRRARRLERRGSGADGHRSPRPVNRQGKAETLRAAAERRIGQGGRVGAHGLYPPSSTTTRRRRKREESVAGEARGTRLLVPRRHPRQGRPSEGRETRWRRGGTRLTLRMWDQRAGRRETGGVGGRSGRRVRRSQTEENQTKSLPFNSQQQSRN